MNQSLADELPAGSNGQRQKGARFGLWLLTAIYILRYVDNVAPQAMKEPMIQEFNLTDTESSLPSTLGYSLFPISALIAGYVVDNNVADHRKLLAAGLVVWSLCTALSGAAHSLWMLIVFRVVAYGSEAFYFAIAYPLLADYYPPRELTIAYGILNMALPLGASTGYALGGVMGSAFGWRATFLLCGIPGLALAALVPHLRLPTKRVNREDSSLRDSRSQPAAGTSQGRYGRDSLGEELGIYYKIVTQPHFFIGMAGNVLTSFTVTFASEWIPTFLERYANAPLAEADVMFAVFILAGAGGGTIAFAKVAQYLAPQLKNANYLVPAVFTVPAVVLAFIFVNSTSSKLLSYTAGTAAHFFVFSFQAPTVAVMIHAIKPEWRARAVSFWTLVQRIFDLIAPISGGIVSDRAGLKTAMQLMWVFLIAADVCWWTGYMLPELSFGVSSQEPAASSVWSLLFDDDGTEGSSSGALGEKARLAGAGQKTTEYDSVRMPQ